MKFLLLLSLLLAAVWSQIDAQTTSKPLSTKIRACYFANWSQLRHGIWSYMPEYYEPGLCSHIFYAFVDMGDDFKLKNIESNELDVANKPGTGLYARVNALKNNQTELKTILSLGGRLFSERNGELMKKMLANKDNRQKFIVDAIEYVRKHKFDGLDICWFPTTETKGDFLSLIKELREAINKEKTPLLLTLAVPSEIDIMDNGYDGKALSGLVDFMNVMSFDYHGGWENQTGSNAPINDRNGDHLSINSTIRHLLDIHQVPAEKVLLGLPAYGRGWIIPSTTTPNTIPSPALGPSALQFYTKEEGMAAYFELCSTIEKDKYVVERDDVAKTPFAYKLGEKQGLWFSYDDVKSIGDKLDFTIENKLAGVFVWTLDLDDFHGLCKSSNGTHPLIKVIRDRLGKN